MLVDASVWVFGITTATVWLAFALALLVLRSRAVRRAKEAEALAPPPLRAGDIALRGTIRAEGSTTPLEVRILQEGTESQIGARVVHRWTELEREVVTFPFWLDLASGESIWVVPNEDTRCELPLDPAWRRLARDRRVLRAAADAGEPLGVSGALARGPTPVASPDEGGYRGGGDGWVLRPHRVGSDEDGTHRREASWLGAWVAVALAGAVLTQLPYLSSYDLAVFGVRCRGTLAERRARATRSSVVNDVVVTTTTCAAPGPFIDTAPPTVSDVEVGEAVDLVVVPARPTHFVLGRRITLSPTGPVLGLVALVLTLALYFEQARRRMPWWEVRRVQSSGRGTLP